MSFKLNWRFRVVIPGAATLRLLVLCICFSILPVAMPAQDLAHGPAPADATADKPLPDAPSASSAAESRSFAGELGRGIVVIGKDEWTFIKAPFRLENLKYDLLFAAVLTPLFATDEQVARQVNPGWHDTGIAVSNGAMGAEIVTVGGIFFTGLATDNVHAKDTGVATARGLADSVILYGALKAILARQRPSYATSEGNFFSGNWSSGSFPSGHSMFDWTIASVVAHEYPKWPVAVAMYGLAAASSTYRVTAGVHFPSDVVAGAAMGYLVGRYVASQENHLPGDSPSHSRTNKMIRVENAILSHVSIGVQ
jgi:membrane-associated phospholipid phosphatase